MRIFLSGPAGSGKSSVARMVGQKGGLPVIDLGERIAAQSGVSTIKDVQRKDDTAFHLLELNTLKGVVEEYDRCVVELAEETVTPRETRRFLLDAGVLVTLYASFDELARRRGQDKGALTPDGREALVRLKESLGERASAYAECHARIDTTSSDPAAVAEEVLEVAAIAPVTVPLGERTCRIEVGSGIRKRLVKYVAEICTGQSPVVIVTDIGVERPWGYQMRDIVAGSGRRVVFVSIPEGESAKQLPTVDTIWNAALDGGIDRSSMLIAVGGGVVGDLGGFAAATLLRGIPLANVPTTLLGMVDSAIGGKTGFDTRHGKNLIGAFHQPRFVLSDIDTLGTLPLVERRAGLAEVVKSAWLDGEAAVRRLERDAAELLRGETEATVSAIRMAAGLKARVVTGDERESGLRMLLNLGHTVGHAIEASMDYRTIRHGEAVSLGMVAAHRLAVRLGRASGEDAERLSRLLQALGLPVNVDDYLTDRSLSFIGSDKKRRSGHINFVVPAAPGKVDIVPLSLQEVSRLVREQT